MTKKLKTIFNSYVIFCIVISIISNIILSGLKGYPMGISSNIFLITFLSCYIFYNKWTLGVLVILSIYFWYHFFTESEFIAVHINPILYFTNSIDTLLGLHYPFQTILRILISPFIVNIYIISVDIPCRIQTEFKKYKKMELEKRT
jgi:hypothetical protein